MPNWVNAFSGFFRDDNSRLSMSRLLMFLAMFPSSYVVIMSAKDINTEIFGLYLATFAGLASWSKWVDHRNKKAETEADTAVQVAQATGSVPDKVSP